MDVLTCPKCEGRMRQYERSGVTVDQCTDCRGIFLDRGELERLVDAENAWHHSQPDRYERRPKENDERRYDYDKPRYDYDKPYKKRRKGFLEELFD